MNWYKFIFSDKPSVRLQRHLLFWILWGLYFSLSYYHYQQVGLQKARLEPWNSAFFVKATCLLIVHILACYFFIDFLMPEFLFKAKYTAFFSMILLLSGAIVITSYIIHKSVFPLINSLFQYHPGITNQNVLWTSISAGLLTSPKVMSAAAAIKLLKRWWLKLQEKERLEKEKMITDLQLLKAQMHPEFLFSSLNQIYILTERKHPEKASRYLLKLADILSYMLYESDHLKVSLEKEIQITKDYLLLEKTRMGNRLEIDIAVKGDLRNRIIAPLLLFPFVEQGFSYIRNKRLEKMWMNLQFTVEGDEFSMKLIHGKTPDDSEGTEATELMNKTIRRLEFFYPGKYELKKTNGPEMMMISLKIILEEFSLEDQDIFSTETTSYAAI